MAIPILWHLDISHFNEKARWALDYKRIPHERKSVFPGMQGPCARMLRGGTSTLPVIDIDGTRIGDSTRIIEQLGAPLAGSAPLPGRPRRASKRALELEDFFDEHCAHELRRVMFDPLLQHPELMAEATGTDQRRGGSALQGALPGRAASRCGSSTTSTPRAQPRRAQSCEAAMDRIEEERGPSGYLVGDSFTVADLTAAAILSPLVGPPEFPYHQVDPARDPEDLRRWREPLHRARRRSKYVLDMYARHRGTTAEVATA